MTLSLFVLVNPNHRVGVCDIEKKNDISIFVDFFDNDN